LKLKEWRRWKYGVRKESISEPVDSSPSHTSWALLGDEKERMTLNSYPENSITVPIENMTGKLKRKYSEKGFGVTMPIFACFPPATQELLVFTADLTIGCQRMGSSSSPKREPLSRARPLQPVINKL
jgi:hypothetical protein